MFSSFFKSSSGTSGTGGTNFEILAPVPLVTQEKHLFKLFEGKLKAPLLSTSPTNDKTPLEASIFVCDTQTQISQASSAVKRLKTLRHPCIVTYLDASETDQKVTLVTEKVTPLSLHLEQLDNQGLRGTARDHYLAWGIFQIMRGLAFLTNDARLRHNSLHGDAVFVTKSGDWKLFCLERVSQLNQSDPSDNLPPASNPNLSKYDPPELTDHVKRRTSTPWSRDMWGLGCIIWEVFNGPLPAPKNLGQLGQIPKGICKLYMELVAASPAKRPNPKEKIEMIRRGNGYFKNEVIDALLFLEELQIKDESEKSRFYTSLPKMLDNFPIHVGTYKILPELIKAYEFGNAGAAILNSVFKLGANLESEEYVKIIVPILIKLFASNDRNARFKLLNQVENFVQHLSDKTVNEEIFPQIQNGFVDQEPMIREKSVIAMIHLAPKLSYSNLDEAVIMKHFSRLLRDDQAGIRTNTTVCLGKIARFLHHGTRQKVLISAFAGKLRDPFPPARIAAINAFAATQQFYTIQETGQKILPALCPALIDPEEPVRTQAFKVTQGFLAKLEQVSKNPELKEEMEVEVTSNVKSGQGASSVASWANWAVGAIGAKFYKSNNPPPGPSKPNPAKSPPEPKESQKPNSLEVKEKSSAEAEVSVSTTEDEVESQDNEEDLNQGEGWDDGEDWGSLETEETQSGDSSAKNKDFFDNWTQDKPVKKKSAAMDDPWLTLEDNNDIASKQQEEEKRNKEEEKRLREEKRLARRAEMEAKKQTRRGPMKLGSKKD